MEETIKKIELPVEKQKKKQEKQIQQTYFSKII